MKVLAFLFVTGLGMIVFAEDFPGGEKAQIVTAVSFEPVGKSGSQIIGLQIIGHPVLDRFQIVDGQSSPASLKVSGRVISNNSGGPIENVGIFINSSLHEPRLAALTNVDGEFKFRLGVSEDVQAWPVTVTPDWEGDLLLFGGERWHGPVPNSLRSGHVNRYRLQTLKKHVEKQ